MSQAVSADFPHKLQFLFQPKRTKVLYGGRGSAKSWSVARALLILSAQREMRILCAREQQNSIAESVHRLLSEQIKKLGLEAIFEIQRDKIICSMTKSAFFFEGIKANVDRIKSYEGVDVCWVEEAHNVSETSWDILIPTIRKENSEIWICFNPNLETDYTYKNFVLQHDPDTVACEMNWRDNPWFPEPIRKEMEKLKVTDYQKYLNIWEGQCRVLLEGAVYSEQLQRLLAERRRTKVPYDPAVPVDTIWDLGWSDRTTIWFRQRCGFEWHYIDYLEDTQKPILHYAMELQRKPYIYGTVWLPHDARAREKGSGMSIEERLRKVFSVRIVKSLSLEDGIDAVRTHLPLAWFDSEKTNEGFKALGAYAYEVREDKGILSKTPVHNWASHASDAMRYSAISATAPRAEAERRGRQLAEALGDKGAAARAAVYGEDFGFGTGGAAKPHGSLGWMNR